MEGNATYTIAQIHCDKCGYTGCPKAIRKPDPLNPDSYYFEMGCPVCNTDEDTEVEVEECIG
jgi:hypothetical protein